MKKVKQKVAVFTHQNKSQYHKDLKTIPSNKIEEGKEFINSEGKEFDVLLFTEDGKIETASMSKLKGWSSYYSSRTYSFYIIFFLSS
jgi:hypothetical protein